jgi:hypothetical protein
MVVLVDQYHSLVKMSFGNEIDVVALLANKEEDRSIRACFDQVPLLRTPSIQERITTTINYRILQQQTVHTGSTGISCLLYYDFLKNVNRSYHFPFLYRYDFCISPENERFF